MALSGNEILQVQGVTPAGNLAATTFTTTTGAIAALASDETSFVSTSITTAGNGTLTAAALVGNVIVRTGPSANYTDTTDTATAIVAAFPGGIAAGSSFVTIKNATAYTQTIAAGTGVTLPPTVIIPPFAEGQYVVVPTSATAVTLTHLQTVAIAVGQTATAPAVTTLSTVGAGTITAASFTTGLTNRTGSQSGTPFTDTTDTAANIIAACANLVNKIGTSFIYYYTNSTNAVATLTGGTGVTVSGITVVPSNMTAGYLITYTAAATITMVGIVLTNSLSTAMSLAGSSSGQTTIVPTAAAAGTLTLPAVTGTMSSTSGTNLDIVDITRCSAALTANNTSTYASITGLVQTVVPGTYRFRCVLPSTVASGTGGIKYAFNYTTTALTSIEATGIGYTASAVAVQHTTTTTTQTDLFTQAAVVIMTILEGSMVVSTGGTINLQMAQNTANGSNTVTLVGSTMEFVRIA